MGPPIVKSCFEAAPTVNRAQPTVLVRMHDGELIGRVSIGLVETLLASGAAKAVGKDRVRYLRLEPGIVVSKSSLGWALFEEERRKYGDSAVRHGAMAFDRRQLKWQPPKPDSR